MPTLAAAASCPPTARIGGDEPLASTIRRILDGRGVVARAPDDCPAVVAVVRGTPAGVEATVADAAGRRVVQTVSDAGTAATIIESWTRSDLGAPLLEERSPRRASATIRATTPNRQPEPRDERLHARAGPAGPPFSVGLASGLALGGDGSRWIDATLAGCIVLRPVCAGALVRGSFDLGESGDSARLDTSRTAVDVLLTADFLLEAGKVTISPGAGFGAGWLRSSPAKQMTGRTREDEDEDLGGLRLQAHVSGRVPLTRRLALDIGLAVNFSPMSRRTEISDYGVVLAGEPRWSVRSALGLRYGGP